MTKEEFERIKEQEKAHLRAIRDLKAKAAEAQRTGRLANAVDRAINDPMRALESHDSVLDELRFSTAQSEARLDIALESASEKAAAAASQEEAEELLRQERARKMVESLRRSASEVALPGPDQQAPPAQEPKAAPPPPPDLPDKTIGRMR